MAIEIKDLSFSYGVTNECAIKNFSHTFDNGSYWCIAGANGSGKSTLLKLIAGLNSQGTYSGSVKIDSQNIADISRISFAQLLAFVPGGAHLQFPITVEELVFQGRYPFKTRFADSISSTDRDKVNEILNFLGLREKRDRLVQQLSWGETALAILGRALAQEPKWLLLDEAVSSLDLGVQRRVFSLLEQINRIQKTGILFVGHDLNAAAEFVPNLLWLHRGSLIGHGSFSEVLKDKLLADVYGESAGLLVGKNPVNQKPKVFFS